MAEVQRPGWLGRLNPTQLAAFRTALAGLYKLAGAALVREQIEACLPPRTPFVVNDRGLIVYPGSDYTKEEVYPLLPANGEAPNGPVNGERSLPLERLLYSCTPIPWQDWVAAWESDRQGKPPDLAFLHPVRLLPLPAPSPEPAPVA
jgi:hypothetical protein